MEILGLLDVPGWVVAIVTFLLPICLYTWYKQNFFKRLGIKTKSTIFFLGDLPDVIKHGLGYIDVKTVEKEGKVFGSFIGNTPSLIINDADMLKQILVKDFSNFTDRMIFPAEKGYDTSLPFATGEHWRYLRSILSPTFSAGKLRNMNPILVRCLGNLTRHLDKKIKEHPEGFDVFSILRDYSLDMILATGFGLEVNAIENPNDEFVKNAKKILAYDPSTDLKFMLAVFFPDLSSLIGGIQVLPKSVMEYFRLSLTPAFEERKKSASTHKDLLQLMINASKGTSSSESQDDGTEEKTDKDFKNRGLTDDEIFDNSLVFMSASFETNAVTLGWFMYYLVLNPDCQNKLVEEIDTQIGKEEPNYDNVFKLQYLDMVLKETQRMSSPVPRLNRMAKEDTVINGVKILKGMDVTFTPLALHYSTEYWEEPNKFDPERFSPENKHKLHEYAFMPFGMGPRNCVGMRLALLEVKATIVGLLQRFSFKKTDSLAVPMPQTKVGDSRGPAEPITLKVQRRE